MPFFHKKRPLIVWFALIILSFLSITTINSSGDLSTALSLLKAKLLSMAGQLKAETLTDDPFYNPPQFDALKELGGSLREWKEKPDSRSWKNKDELNILKMLLKGLLNKEIIDTYSLEMFSFKPNLKPTIKLLNERLSANLDIENGITKEQIEQIKEKFKKDTILNSLLEKIFRPIFIDNQSQKQKIQFNPLTLEYNNNPIKKVIIYDIDSQVYQGCAATNKDLLPGKFTSNQGVGCGFHALKNLIFMAKFFTEKDAEKRKIILSDMKSNAVFLHYGEGGTEQKIVTDHKAWKNKWADDEPGAKNWISVWKTKPSDSDHLTPETFLDDIVEFRRIVANEKDEKNKVFLPSMAKEILEHAVMLGDVTWGKKESKKGAMTINFLEDTEEAKKNAENDLNVKIEYALNSIDSWIEGIKHLRKIITDKKFFVIPIHLYYTYYNFSISSSPIKRSILHHWFAMVLRKVITHPLSGWLDGCEQPQGLPI